MTADNEIYADYAKYAQTVANVKPLPFGSWAYRRDELIPEDRRGFESFHGLREPEQC